MGLPDSLKETLLHADYCVQGLNSSVQFRALAESFGGRSPSLGDSGIWAKHILHPRSPSGFLPRARALQKSCYNNGTNISSHLLAVFRAFSLDLCILDVQHTLLREDFSMKSQSACFVLGCKGLFPFPVSLNWRWVCFRDRCLEQVGQENSCACWGVGWEQSVKMKAAFGAQKASRGEKC